MVHADHSCGITDDDGSIIYGGEACGYIVEFENGYKIYHAGDTAVFGDMELIADIYAPDLCPAPDRRPLRHVPQGSRPEPLPSLAQSKSSLCTTAPSHS